MRIIYLASRFPYPLEKGDKLRAYHQIREFSKNHEVILFALSDKAVDEKDLQHLKSLCKEVHLFQLGKWDIFWQLFLSFFNRRPFQVGYFFRKKLKLKLREIIGRAKPDAIFCQLIRMAEYVRDLKDIPTTLDYMDVFSKGMERRAERSSFPMKIAISMEYKRLMQYEQEVFRDFNHRLIISAQDRSFIPHPEREKIIVVPNGVDYEYFFPKESEKKHDLLFAGNMAYPPNVESVSFIVKEVMPEVWKKRPQTTLLIAGATPTKEVLDLASDKVIITGWVDDIRDSFSSSRIMLAPMLISIGLQNKILQAMAMKIPCIVSRLANNAIDAPVPDCIRIAATPSEYTNQIMELLSFPEKGKVMSDSAYDFVHSTFDWSKANLRIEEVLFTK